MKKVIRCSVGWSRQKKTMWETLYPSLKFGGVFGALGLPITSMASDAVICHRHRRTWSHVIEHCPLFERALKYIQADIVQSQAEFQVGHPIDRLSDDLGRRPPSQQTNASGTQDG